MAKRRFFPFARRRDAIGSTITASARRINLQNPDEVKRWVRKPQEWQKWAWTYYDLNGQLKYGINFLANVCSRARLYVGMFDPAKPTDRPEAVGPEDPGVDALDLLRDGIGSHAELIRRAIIHLSVPGEFYVVGMRQRMEERPVDPTQPWGEREEVETLAETWGIYSTEEVTASADGKVEVRPGGEEGGDAKKIKLRIGEEDGEDGDFLLRVWLPHAKFGDQPDSAVHGVLGDCEDLLDLRRMMRACDRSRTGAGGLIWPTEETAGLPDPSQTATQDGDERKDPVMKALEDATLAVIENPDDPSTVAPALFRVSAQYAGAVKPIEFGRKVTSQDLERWGLLVGSLEQGVNLPVGAITGYKDMNHWNVWKVADEVWSTHGEPLMLAMVASLTTGYLRPYIEAEADANDRDADEERVSNTVIWYDPAAVVRDPDPDKTADELHDRKAISDEAYRKRRGVEDGEAPDPEELARRLGMERGTVDTSVVLSLLRIVLPSLAPAEELMGQGELPPGDEEGDDDGEGEEGPPEENATTAAATPRRARRDLGGRLRSLDQGLRVRLQASWSAAMRRAVDRAGARVLGAIPRADRRRLGLDGVAHADIPARVRDGDSDYALDEDRLLEGAFEALQSEFDDLVGRTQERALDLVPRLSRHRRDTTAAQMASDRARAWEVAQASLIELARDRLYDPAPEAPPLGEFDAAATVPFGIVRESVAAAGGAQEAGTWTGIGSGPTVVSLLRDQGVERHAFRWVYGEFPRTREFEPHRDLDGAEFENFDDDVLANNEEFPPVDYYMPGDHDGCGCDFEQVFEDTAIAATAGVPPGTLLEEARL